MYLIDTSFWIESLKKDSKFKIQEHFKVHATDLMEVNEAPKFSLNHTA